MSFLRYNFDFCFNCLKDLKAKFKTFYINGYRAIYLYGYDDLIKKYLYEIKGCYDIELAPLFLCRYQKELSILYKDHILVPIPSYIKDDEAREFNHVEEIFKPLNLKMVKALYKSERYKQSDQKKADRKNISKILKMSNIEKIKNQNILLVDDVYTTGNTMKSAIKLIESAGVKKISILLIAKVRNVKIK